MCSIILGVEPGRFWLAANRDELLARPARGPFWWHQGFLAGRDEQAGGTWLGLNQRGLAVGVTNRFGAQRHPERGSRGALVVDALARRPRRAALKRTRVGLARDTEGLRGLPPNGRSWV